jgi:hypothetical protein
MRRERDEKRKISGRGREGREREGEMILRER